MKKRLKATWWYEPNFGDALNPYLLSKLSGCQVEYCPEHRPFFKVELKRILSNPFKYDWRRMKWPETKEPVVMAIGSMLEHSRPNYIVWGTGFLRETGEFPGGTILAVRGQFSSEKLVQQGYTKCEVYGDPALLLPLIYKPHYHKAQVSDSSSRLGIIPHYADYEEIRGRFAMASVIDMNTYDVEKVIDEIVSCDYVFSSSLHGIIVAHAYGIPALWIRGNGTGKENIKFRDYFSSVGIPLYDGNYRFSEMIDMNYCYFNDELKALMLPDKNTILRIQNQLLQVAPFHVVV